VSLVVVTPSHAPDFPSFARLHESVVRNTEAHVRHLVAVPDLDVDLFRNIDTGRLDVLGYRDILPRSFRSTTRLARLPRLPRGYRIGAVNARRPWPPLRGWILQQVVKLAVVSGLEDDVAVLIDSDVVVVRPLEEATFRVGDAVRLYRLPHGITPQMTRHHAWLSTALQLLHPPGDEPGTPDYISAFASWSPEQVRRCTQRVEGVAAARWQDVVGSRLQLSEFILYGTAATTLPDAVPYFESDRTLCHSWWDPVPLDRAGAEAFLEGLRPDDLAVHIQSNSQTSDDVLRFVAARAAAGG
jgi:hypothetical protein